MMRSLVFLMFLFSTAGAFAASRPNIVLFITDDESWLERSAYGWSKVPTPNFGRVAREGVLFTRGYTSAPSCAPSRASLLAGRNFWELEQGAFIQAWLPKKFPVFPALLAASGYHTGRIGKGWGPGVYPEEGYGPDVAGQVYNRLKLKSPEKAMSPIDYAGNFSAFLDDRKGDTPFFCWIGSMEPHGPWDKGNRDKLKERHGISPEDVPMPGFLPDDPATRQRRADMTYEILHADEQLGKVIGELERRGELVNTILVVTSDNGTAIEGSKAGPYDWGVHEPLAIMWPDGIPAGRTIEDFVGFPDFAPTFLEAAGLPVPESMSGRSILGLLRSGKSGWIDPARDTVVTGLEWHGELPPESRSSRTIRDATHQYIVRYGGGSGPIEEFYDLEKDPDHKVNLVGSSDHAGALARLKGKMKEYQLKTGDPRATGEMAIFDSTRAFVQKRKAEGYKDGEGE